MTSRQRSGLGAIDVWVDTSVLRVVVDDIGAMRAACQYLKGDYEEDLPFTVRETRTRKCS